MHACTRAFYIERAKKKQKVVSNTMEKVTLTLEMIVLPTILARCTLGANLYEMIPKIECLNI